MTDNQQPRPAISPELQQRDVVDRVEMYGVMRLAGYPDRAKSMLLSAWLFYDSPYVDDNNTLKSSSTYSIRLEFRRDNKVRAIRHYVGYSLDKFELQHAYNKPA